MSVRRWLPWLALLVVLGGALLAGTVGDDGPRTDAERTAALADSLRCPTCRGQSVLDSDAPAAANIRNQIAERVRAGQSDEEIRAALVARFGRTILLTPPRSGVGGLVWVLPVAGLVIAVAGLAVAFRRWRLAPAGEPTDADRELVARARAERPSGWRESGT